MSIYVDFHVLQTVPPSCVNRDDTGSPKTAVYGGSVRARVSSQAWKHAMRKEFRGMFAEDDLGNRTKNVVQLVAQEMQSINASLDEKKCLKKASDALKAAGISLKAKKEEIEKADALFFMSNRQAKEIARLACGDTADKNDFKKALKEYPSVDIALFGRMAASDPTLNYDAASQVAHAISTHAVQNEYDYFTAVDDISEDDNAGAGHLGTVEFNSSTLYRYANVNVSELRKTLDDAADVAVVVRKFAEAFIRSMPTGKENTFANRTFPDAVYVTIRMDQPVNLCGAFEKPVRASEDGYATESEKRLAAYAEKVYSQYAAEPKAAFCIGDALSDIAQQMSLPELLDTLESNLREQVSEA
ncbi:type I-E CRISPR-associated protein Cas7/Cse4/CasC [Ruminococcus callidus]|uniref:type I-E CRISPR-associated protein Cas7/Cse4/CasC n=1 Tax=Ruminococcus callidus TaxID=40519 RepID=UPI0035210D77